MPDPLPGAPAAPVPPPSPAPEIIPPAPPSPAPVPGPEKRGPGRPPSSAAASTKKDPRDRFGRPFDASLHVTLPGGKPKLTRDGNLTLNSAEDARLRQEKLHKQAIDGAAAKDASAKANGDKAAAALDAGALADMMTSALGVGVAALTGAKPDPLALGEFRAAAARYAAASGLECSPGVALAIAGLGVAAPCVMNAAPDSLLGRRLAALLSKKEDPAPSMSGTPPPPPPAAPVPASEVIISSPAQRLSGEG